MSRASIVAMLVAAELVIVGIAIFSLRAPHVWAAPSEEAAKTFAPIDAGSSPHVEVNDPQSRVVVGVSDDARVHVSDAGFSGGWFFGGRTRPAPLQVQRTPDGLKIERPGASGSLGFQIGWVDRHIEIDVPRNARLDVSGCAGAEVSGIAGDVAVRSQDGRIRLSDLSGAVDASSDDGSVSATRVRGASLTMHSNDGRLTLEDVAVGTLEANTNDGSITARRLNIAGSAPKAVLHSDDGSIRFDAALSSGGSYEFSTNDGSIHAALPRGADLTIDASTGDGDVVVDGAAASSKDGANSHRTVTLGSGSGSLRLSSGDGSIHILTNGAV
jgi:hypothetical protein